MPSSDKVRVPSGWMMCNAKERRSRWTSVPSLDGETTTVDILRMLESSVKVGRTQYNARSESFHERSKNEFVHVTLIASYCPNLTT